VGREYTNDKATDFNAILTKLKGAKPDLVFYGGMDAVAGPMLRQMKQLGIDAKFMGGDGICTAELPKLAGDAWRRQGDLRRGRRRDGRQGQGDGRLPAKFKSKFNMDVQIYAPYVYDAVNDAMVAAMQKANSTDPKKYLSAGEDQLRRRDRQDHVRRQGRHQETAR
jgi:branched-chain amino acid transport system substrate-binding protein